MRSRSRTQDSVSNRVVAPAPLFDHGNSLFSLAGRAALSGEREMAKYGQTLVPCAYDDFTEEARKVMTKEHKNRLRGLLGLRLRRHGKYNLPPERLKLIEKTVSARVKELLK